MLSETATRISLRAILALAGVAAAIGLLVVLRNSQIPFFLYYPRFTNTVLISDSFDTYLFLAAILCVPASLVIFILQPRARRNAASLQQLILVAVAAACLLSLAFMLNYPSLAAVVLLCATVAAVAVNVSVSGSVYGLEWSRTVTDVMISMLTIFALIELSPVYYWALSSMDPGALVGREAAELEINLTYSLFPVAPLILFGALLSWLWVPLASRILRAPSSTHTMHTPTKSFWKLIDQRTFLASLDLIAILAIAVFYYPYFAGQKWLVGVDAYMNYLDPLVSLSGLTLSRAVKVLLSTFHGPYVGLLFLAELATGLSPFLIVKYAPLAFVFLTSLILFWIFLEFTGNYRSKPETSESSGEVPHDEIALKSSAVRKR